MCLQFGLDVNIINIYLWKLFPLKVWGCRLYITTGGLFCSVIFGALRVLSVWGFTLFEMGDNFPIDGSEGGKICADMGFYAGSFCVIFFTLS